MSIQHGARVLLPHLGSHFVVGGQSVTAYILALNKIIGDNDVMNAETLPKVKMPNRDGFVSLYPDKH
jgi:hypothetical protein